MTFTSLTGIKPCVSAFGGDQFVRSSEREVTSYFLAFYFSINLGSFCTYIITPLAKYASSVCGCLFHVCSTLMRWHVLHHVWGPVCPSVSPCCSHSTSRLLPLSPPRNIYIPTRVTSTLCTSCNRALLCRRYVSYSAGFGIPAGMLAIALAVFYSARRKYTINPPTGSVLSKFFGCVNLIIAH